MDKLILSGGETLDILSRPMQYVTALCCWCLLFVMQPLAILYNHINFSKTTKNECN